MPSQISPEKTRLAYTVSELAAATGICVETIRALIHSGQLKAKRVRANQKTRWSWLIAAKDWDTYMDDER
jgi:excisionase family DNA binding protein